MIVQKKEDYRIYVEDDDKNWLSTEFVREAENKIHRGITVHFGLNNVQRSIQDNKFDIVLTKEEIIAMSNLFNECKKLLE